MSDFIITCAGKIIERTPPTKRSALTDLTNDSPVFGLNGAAVTKILSFESDPSASADGVDVLWGAASKALSFSASNDADTPSMGAKRRAVFERSHTFAAGAGEHAFTGGDVASPLISPVQAPALPINPYIMRRYLEHRKTTRAS